MAINSMTAITIDGKSYDMMSMSDAAKQQLANIQATDSEIQRLQIQMAIAQTARVAYAAALNSQLPKTEQ